MHDHLNMQCAALRLDLRVATGAPWACLILILSGMGPEYSNPM